MKNYVQPGKTLTLTMPYARSSGQGVLVGLIFGVCTADALIGAVCEVSVEGVYTLAKEPSVAWATIGLAIFWDDTNKRCTVTATGNKFIGHNLTTTGAGAGEITADVLIGLPNKSAVA